MTIVRHPEIPAGISDAHGKAVGSKTCRIAASRRQISTRHAAIDWIWGIPDPHTRQEVVASSVTPAVGEPAETKKALLRRCFKSRPPLEKRLRPGFAPVTGRPGGGFPPTGTRPQARAKLGKRGFRVPGPLMQGKISGWQIFFGPCRPGHAPFRSQPRCSAESSVLPGIHRSRRRRSGVPPGRGRTAILTPVGGGGRLL